MHINQLYCTFSGAVLIAATEAVPSSEKKVGTGPSSRSPSNISHLNGQAAIFTVGTVMLKEDYIRGLFSKKNWA